MESEWVGSAVVKFLDHDRQAWLFTGGQRWRLRTVFCSRLKNDSMAALSAQASTRRIEPRNRASRRARTQAWERRWLPRSEWTVDLSRALISGICAGTTLGTAGLHPHRLARHLRGADLLNGVHGDEHAGHG
jgi:hypothetical protein